MGVAVAVVMALLARDPSFPLGVTALMTTFNVVWASQESATADARNRILGAGAGAVLVAVLGATLGDDGLAVVAGLAAWLGLALLSTSPPLAVACFVVVTVGLGGSSWHGTPLALAAAYVVTVLAATAVSLVTVGVTRRSGHRT